MPEILEVEQYRRAAEAALGRRIVRVEVPQPQSQVATGPRWPVAAPELAAALEGHELERARRRGKLLLLDVEDGSVLGLHFGMTGRLLVDGQAPIERLEYGPAVADPRYDRFILHFADGGELRVNDPRRLGWVELDPDESRLGSDAFGITDDQLAAVLGGSKQALKARLMDQARVAGLGNLLTDEVLWRVGLAPTRPAASLDPDELARLGTAVRATLEELAGRGGSHTGDLMGERHPGGHCPSDGAELRVERVGGRTTWWCPHHQR